MKKLASKYSNKMVENRYSPIKVEPSTEKESVKPSIIYAPYVPIWQISTWMRFKLFLYRLFYRKRKK